MRLMIKIALLFVLLIGGYGLYQYNKGPESLSSKSVDIKISSIELFQAFQTDENAFNTKYLDKILSVSGKVASIKTNDSGLITIGLAADDMMFGVNCEMDKNINEQLANIKKGDQINIKGRCSGALMDVVLNKCILN